MRSQPAIVRVADLVAGLTDPAWDTPAARAVLALFDDEARAAAVLSLGVRMPELIDASDDDLIDVHVPHPDAFPIALATLNRLLQLPFVRNALTAPETADRSNDSR